MEFKLEIEIILKLSQQVDQKNRKKKIYIFNDALHSFGLDEFFLTFLFCQYPELINLVWSVAEQFCNQLCVRADVENVVEFVSATQLVIRQEILVFLVSYMWEFCQ